MLPRRLREIRRERGIRQEEISSFLGVKRQTYSAYERGVSVPDSLTLKKLADYFDVTIETFFHDPAAEESLVLQEQQLLLLARKASRIPKNQRERLIKNFEENIELYLEAMGLDEGEEGEEQ
ncbi:MAG: helix-turn-helix domain-containing protein [Oscillospiraceae bacterium]|nr:helix-turn-helix domain-containing protein [Oscillospiraceae bacterium]